MRELVGQVTRRKRRAVWGLGIALVLAGGLKAELRVSRGSLPEGRAGSSEGFVPGAFVLPGATVEPELSPQAARRVERIVSGLKALPAGRWEATLVGTVRAAGDAIEQRSTLVSQATPGEGRTKWRCTLTTAPAKPNAGSQDTANAGERTVIGSDGATFHMEASDRREFARETLGQGSEGSAGVDDRAIRRRSPDPVLNVLVAADGRMELLDGATSVAAGRGYGGAETLVISRGDGSVETWFLAAGPFPVSRVVYDQSRRLARAGVPRVGRAEVVVNYGNYRAGDELSAGWQPPVGWNDVSERLSRRRR